jgi:hypothetical protein
MNIPPSQDFPVVQCNVDANGAQLHIPIGYGITLTVALSGENLVQMTAKLKEEQKKAMMMMQTIDHIRRGKNV